MNLPTWLPTVLVIACLGVGTARESRGEWLVESAFSPSWIEGYGSPANDGENLGALGLKFSLANSALIGTVEGQLFSPHRSGIANLAIYSNGEDGLPNNVLYSHGSYIEVSSREDMRDFNRHYGSQWYGGHDLNWPLSAGEYWLVVEPDPTDPIRIGIVYPSTPRGARYPLATRRSYLLPDSDVLSTDFKWMAEIAERQVALRIDGQYVPEPPSAALLALGVAFAAMRQRNPYSLSSTV